VASTVSLVRSQVYHTEHPPLRVHFCLQHVCHDAAHYTGSSATADTSSDDDACATFILENILNFSSCSVLAAALSVWWYHLFSLCLCIDFLIKFLWHWH